MAFTDKQREALISELGEPKLSIEFDVWSQSKVSMWAHFDHSDNYTDVKKRLIAIRDHLDEFLKDEKMCPFHKPDTL